MMLFTLDTVCVIAMAKSETGHPAPEVAAIGQLIDRAVDGEIGLQLAAAYDRDFDRYNSPEGRTRQQEWLANAPIATPRAPGLFILDVSVLGGPDVLASDEGARLYKTIRAMLAAHENPSWDNTKRTSDADHLIAHHLSGAEAFVTMDTKTILAHKAELSGLGIIACWPSEAINLIEGDARP